MNTTPTAFEMKVLRVVLRGGMLAGNGYVAISAAVRRLERKGLVVQSSTIASRWYLTDEGEAILQQSGDRVAS